MSFSSQITAGLPCSQTSAGLKRRAFRRHHLFSGAATLAAMIITATAGAFSASAATLTDVRAGDAVKVDVRVSTPAVLAGSDGKIYLRIDLEGGPLVGREQRTPVNVGLVVDRSGSMADGKLDRAKEATTMALGRLGGEDYAAVVAYDHNVDVVFPAGRMTQHSDVMAAIRRLRPGGRTALYAGVEQGLREVRKFLSSRRVNRVILLSDGLANVGPASPSEMAALAREAARQGVSITTIGLGLGYNEDLMAKLAYTSDGNHAFVENADQLATIFNREFGDAQSIVAQDIIIEIEIAPGFRPNRTLGREGKIEGQRVELRLNQVHAAQAKYAMIELTPTQGTASAPGRVDLANVAVRYRSIADDAVASRQARVSVDVTTDEREAERRIDKDVMAEVTAQKATLISEQAVELRDRGDVLGAAQLLRSHAASISSAAQAYGSSELRELSESFAADAEAVAAPSEDWSKSRKAMRARQHGLKVQQTY